MTGKIFTSIKLMEIGKMLKRGNEKSKDLGALLENLVRLYAGDEFEFEEFIIDLGKEEYERASKKYNTEIYQEAGGKLGSGEYKALTLDEVNLKLGEGMAEKISGIDPEGFRQFQAFILFITEISSGNHPLMQEDESPSFPIMLVHLRTACWYLLFSIYYEDCLKNIRNKINAHKIFDPNLN